MAENQANGAPSPLRDDARRLILRERLDGCDPEDSAELVAWRRQSIVHETAFQDEMRVWSLATQALAPTAYPKAGNDRARPSRRRFITGATVAASAAGVGFVGIVEGSLPGYTDLVSDHSTGRGEQRSIRLNGDVSVILDGDTALNVTGRGAEVVRGAAVFAAGQNTRLTPSFEIQAMRGVVKLAAGEVAISTYGTEVEVACIDKTADVTAGSGIVLSRGEAVRYSGGKLSSPFATEPDQVAAWRNGYFVFRDDPLSNVVSVLNRHRPGHIMIAERSVAQRRISGAFPLNDPEEVLQQMLETLSIKAARLPAGFIILRS